MLDDLAARFEAASRTYAARGVDRDDDWFLLKMHEEIGALTQAWNRLTGRGRRHGASEPDLRQALTDDTADLLGHVLLSARRNDLDLAAAIERKWRSALGDRAATADGSSSGERPA